MKNIKVLLLSLMAGLLLNACQTVEPVEEGATVPALSVDYNTLWHLDTYELPLDRQGNMQVAFTVKFRWHGKGGSGGCNAPLGICLSIPIGKNLLTQQMIADGYGWVDLVMISSTKMKMIFHRMAAYNSPGYEFVDLTGGLGVTQAVAGDLGYASIRVVSGIYPVTFTSGHPYGVAVVDVVTH